MKFSIRDLLLVTVIVALALGWFLDHRLQSGRLRSVGVYLSHFAGEYKRDIRVDDAGQVTEFIATFDPPNPFAPVRQMPKKWAHEVQPAEPDDCRDALLRPGWRQNRIPETMGGLSRAQARIGQELALGKDRRHRLAFLFRSASQ
ncbi:MAG: hypothetical protein IAF94_03910 [Pirellulaceae bacterium]|nr:hypothetical protein [Pirellulaceae bacterium]